MPPLTPAEYQQVAAKVLQYLRASPLVLTAQTSQSTRATGDAVQSVLTTNFVEIVSPELRVELKPDAGRRAMADLTFADSSGNVVTVDVKTHRLDTKFSMPNLISISRLAEFYQASEATFAILLVSYEMDASTVVPRSTIFAPIEWLDWQCLTLGALGKGQIQIKNSKNLEVRPEQDRRDWMLVLCERVLEFYPREIRKAEQRIQEWERIRAQWAAVE